MRAMELYQGRTMLEAHSVPLKLEQGAFGATSQVVSFLANTMSPSNTTAIFEERLYGTSKTKTAGTWGQQGQNSQASIQIHQGDAEEGSPLWDLLPCHQ